MPPFAGEALSRLAHQHPLICVQANGDKGTYKISDFLSRRQFHSLALYHDLYRRIGAEDQIAFGLPGPIVIGVALNRGRGQFSERDRAMLDLLAPHLTRARDRIVERAQSGALIAILDQARRLAGTEVIALGRDDKVTAASGGAFPLLRTYFGDAGGTDLPAALVDWLEGSTHGEPIPGRVPLTVTSERGRLTVREAPVRGLDGVVLALEEQRAVTVDSLRSLGLTPRQCEVLALLVAGMGTAQIAEALVISPVTVRKHFEHLYERLGVHSRAEAIAVAQRSAAAQPL